MSIVRMPISEFVTELRAALNRKDGYIMGTKGQDPKKLSSWYFEQYNPNSASAGSAASAKTYKQALYWKANAARVWDCNGLAEGIYETYTGVNINTKARYNYANWCGVKGSGTIPANQRVAGAAVFWSDTGASKIHHVAYLDRPVNAGTPEGDWYLIEARGVLTGVVQTKLSARKPNFWGTMDKYFDYDGAAANVPIILRNGDEGEAVKILQTSLIRLGYDCGKWGADGDFGDATELALKAFQAANGLDVDGVYGEKSAEAIDRALAALDAPVENPRIVEIYGGNCYIRTEPNTNGAKLGVAHAGDKYTYGGATADNEWNSIVYNGASGWVSGKYSKLT